VLVVKLKPVFPVPRKMLPHEIYVCIELKALLSHLTHKLALHSSFPVGSASNKELPIAGVTLHELPDESDKEPSIVPNTFFVYEIFEASLMVGKAKMPSLSEPER
jgi:hypothetical protein